MLSIKNLRCVCFYLLSHFISCKTIDPQPLVDDRRVHRPWAYRVSVDVVRHIIPSIFQRWDTYEFCSYPGPHQWIMRQILALDDII